MGTARLLKSNLPDFRGVASMYELDPPLEGNRFVVVAGVDNSQREITPMIKAIDDLLEAFGVLSEKVGDGFLQETYIFPVTSTGEVISWLELPGSYRGDIDHIKALERAGYQLDIVETISAEGDREYGDGSI